MSSKINLQTCEYACKSSIFQDNQLIYTKKVESSIVEHLFVLLQTGHKIHSFFISIIVISYQTLSLSELQQL